jgi:hypothetical protein
MRKFLRLIAGFSLALRYRRGTLRNTPLLAVANEAMHFGVPTVSSSPVTSAILATRETRRESEEREKRRPVCYVTFGWNKWRMFIGVYRY